MESYVKETILRIRMEGNELINSLTDDQIVILYRRYSIQFAAANWLMVKDINGFIYWAVTPPYIYELETK